MGLGKEWEIGETKITLLRSSGRKGQVKQVQVKKEIVLDDWKGSYLLRAIATPADIVPISVDTAVLVKMDFQIDQV